MKPGNFFAELQRRNVYKVAVAYAIAGWLVVQIATQVFPFFEIPNWAVRLVVLLIVLGFPVALLLSWFFDLTRYGIVRTRDLEPAPKIDISPTCCILSVASSARPQDGRVAVDGLMRSRLGTRQ